ncbi:MAG: ABC transporter ATP-binding protein [Candidatus Thermoplasmatota archaeon]|nr:ABC transporter ATP-binding protein [Candidatus Thermoplasmatota archaeon]
MIRGSSEENVLLFVSGVKKYFPIYGGIRGIKGFVKAVDDVTFTVREGESLGIVGETGCGKTTLGRTLLHLIRATEGETYFDVPKEELARIMELEQKEKDIKEELARIMELEQKGKNVGDDMESANARYKEVMKELAPLRRKYSLNRQGPRHMLKHRKNFQPVFQDPFSSLDPRKLVKDIIGEPMKILLKMNREEIMKREKELIDEIGLSEDHLFRFPHEFSGGQRQRIGIARAISIEPKMLVLDEPTSALDVSVQAQILNILRDLQNRRGLSFIFISHHLNVIRMMSDRVAVMYLGKIVELADTERLFSDVLHPYTKALLSAIPIPDPETKVSRIVLEGEIPNPSDPPRGCHFHPRCPVAMSNCGWSPRDLAEPLRTMLNPTRNAEASDITGVEEIESDEDMNTVELLFREDVPVGQKELDIIRSLVEKETLLKTGTVFKAIKEVSLNPERNAVHVEMSEYDTPGLKEVRRGHFVSCLLYNYNYFDRESPEGSAQGEPAYTPYQSGR